MSSQRSSQKKRRTKFRVGGFDDQQRAFELLGGYGSLAEVFRWPDSAYDILTEHDTNTTVKRRLQALVNTQTIMYSFYGGTGTDASVFAHITRALAKRGYCAADDLPFRHIAGADSNPVCVDVMKTLHTGPRKLYKHVFGNHFHRFTDEVHDYAEALQRIDTVDFGMREQGRAYEDFKDYSACAVADGALFK